MLFKCTLHLCWRATPEVKSCNCFGLVPTEDKCIKYAHIQSYKAFSPLAGCLGIVIMINSLFQRTHIISKVLQFMLRIHP